MSKLGHSGHLEAQCLLASEWGGREEQADDTWKAEEERAVGSDAALRGGTAGTSMGHCPPFFQTPGRAGYGTRGGQG